MQLPHVNFSVQVDIISVRDNDKDIVHILEVVVCIDWLFQCFIAVCVLGLKS